MNNTARPSELRNGYLPLRNLFILIFLFLTSSAHSQEYPFIRDFAKGEIMLKDSSIKPGLIKWFPEQEGKLIYRENEKADKQKYAPADLLGFRVDTLKFVSISDFEIYGSDYALLGKTTKIKHTFGQLLGQGSINIYLVFYSGYNAMSQSAQSYPNILFEKRTADGLQYAAYPLGVRMRDKKYEMAKDSLYSFFKDYPEIVEKIKAYKQRDDFFVIVNAVKNLKPRAL